MDCDLVHTSKCRRKLSGLDEVDAGTILIEGQEIQTLSDNAKTEYRAKRVGFVFQTFQLVPTLSALENVSVPLELRGDRGVEHRAAELLAHVGLGDRLECVSAGMFVDEVPPGVAAILRSNVLHDWDVRECRELVTRLAAALPPGGKLLVHDVFLNDELDGPLPIALYSAALFSLTEGRDGVLAAVISLATPADRILTNRFDVAVTLFSRTALKLAYSEPKLMVSQDGSLPR